MELDHAVINVKWKLDRAERLFASYGFTVSPRGHHSLGSVNHTMVFPDNYLELIGLPAGADKVRQQILAAPVGLDGLVFKTGNADETLDRLRSRGFAVGTAKSFSRPVMIDGEEHLARFRTVTLDPASFPAGRVYFCEHETPELVWRPEWMKHANQTTAIREVVVVSTEPEPTASLYAAAAGTDNLSGNSETLTIELGVARLQFLSPRRYRDRYGNMALAMNDRSSMFGAVVLSTGNITRMTRMAQAFDKSSAKLRIASDRILIEPADFNALIEFVG